MDYGTFLTGMFGAGGIIGFLQFLTILVMTQFALGRKGGKC